jgi:hypothetical protein
MYEDDPWTTGRPGKYRSPNLSVEILVRRAALALRLAVMSVATAGDVAAQSVKKCFLFWKETTPSLYRTLIRLAMN